MKDTNDYYLILYNEDGHYLVEDLGAKVVNNIENILEAYVEGEIDFSKPRNENGEIEFDGNFELIVNDKSYKEVGYEILVLKWYEGFEDVGYLISVLQFERFN